MIFTETATSSKPTFIPDEIKSRILCFGDSLTWGDARRQSRRDHPRFEGVILK